MALSTVLTTGGSDGVRSAIPRTRRAAIPRAVTHIRRLYEHIGFSSLWSQ
jgi:hypothetical protein